MPRLLTLMCLISVLAAPASAAASRHRSPAPRGRPHRSAAQIAAASNPQTLAVTIAERYWQATPCGGQVTVLARRPLAAGLDPTTDAWVTFASSLGPNDLAAPADTYTSCVITLARWQWPTRAAMSADWNMFCLTVIHEWGHLLGHAHSAAPGSVMAPVFSDESDVPSICRHALQARAVRR
jgi:hypothetical protein